MSSKLNRHAYEKLIAEDIEWLLKQPRTLEREHIAEVLRCSPDREYEDRSSKPVEIDGEKEFKEYWRDAGDGCDDDSYGMMLKEWAEDAFHAGLAVALTEREGISLSEVRRKIVELDRVHLLAWIDEEWERRGLNG